MDENRHLSKSDKTVAHAVSLLDAEDPRALVNLVPDAVRTAIEAGYSKRPDLFGMDERTLRKNLTKDYRAPTITENRLRLAFWQEYERAQAHGSPAMNMNNVVAGVCSRQYFNDHYLKIPENVAWVLCIPANYEVVISETLHFGLEKLREMLEVDPIDPVSKRPNVKLMELQAKIVEMVQVRAKGAVVQKNLNLNANASDVKKAVENESMESLTKRLKDLERIEQKSLSQGNDKETFVVESEVVPPSPLEES